MEWISVDDRLPEFDQVVMWFNGKDVWSGYVMENCQGIYFFDSNEWMCCYSPNQYDYQYWMPIPTPPTKK